MGLTILPLMDEVKCYQFVRSQRWPEGVRCPHCESAEVAKRGFDDTQKARQRYHCKGCDRDFDDLTNTIFAGRHQPLTTWVMCLYLMGLNLSNLRIALELGLNPDSVQAMTTALRQGIEDKQPEVKLEGIVEIDEVYVVSGHKGHPEAVKKKGEKAVGDALKVPLGVAHWRKKSPQYWG